MKITLSSLKRFIDFDLTVQEVADKLTQLGIEVDAILYESPPFSGIVVGQIKSLKKHPEADTFLNFASFRTAFEVTKEALEINSISTLMVTAEGIPERFTRTLNLLAKQTSLVDHALTQMLPFDVV